MGKIIKAADVRQKPRRISEKWDKELEEIATRSRSNLVDSKQLRETTVKLACAMTQKFVGESLKLDPNLIDRIYERTVEELGGLSPIMIRVHPRDRSDSEIDVMAKAEGWEIVEDASVGHGGCVVESCGVTVERKLDQALQAFREICK